MRLLIFAIFAISAIITIEGTQPNSKRDVWLLSLIIPMLSAFTAAFFAWCLFTFNPNRSLGFLGAVWQREIL